MATANPVGQNNLEKLSWYLDHCKHTVWDSFSADQQNRMIEDDLLAGTSVATVLASLIATGLVLIIVTVLAVLVMG
ncbi:MAG: hypothetical protein HY288_06315 [Planctomycetia bacterium]|nr:hypothetical protein [Planctomycetia bacterium]